LKAFKRLKTKGEKTMAGKFAYISLNDYSVEADLFGPYLEGRTHGCDCCSHEVKITKKDLQDHIESLQKALDATRKLFKYFDKRGFSRVK
jgi:hypothetical protein